MEKSNFISVPSHLQFMKSFPGYGPRFFFSNAESFAAAPSVLDVVAEPVIIDSTDRSKWTLSQWQTEIAKVSKEAVDNAKDSLKRDAEKIKLEEEQRWQDLYALEKQKVADLEKKSSLVISLSEKMNATIDKAVETWDKDLKESDPGKNDVNFRIAWFDQNSKIALRLAAIKVSSTSEGGNRSSFVPGVSGASEDEKSIVNSFVNRQNYAVPGRKKS